MQTTDITKDPNHIVYLKLLESGKLIHYVGTHIAIVGGTLVDNDLSRDALLGRVREQFSTEPIYIKRIPEPGKEDPTLDTPRVNTVDDVV